MTLKTHQTPTPSESLDVTPFAPANVQAVLEEIASPDRSFTDIARAHSTSFEALTLWLARPKIAERLLAMESASARRARFNISLALPRIAHLLTESLDQAQAEAAHLDRLPHNAPCFALRLRYRENIRKSVAHLLRLSNFDPTAKPRAAAPVPYHARFHPDDSIDADSASSPIPQSEIRNPKSPIPNPKSQLPAPRHSAFSAPSAFSLSHKRNSKPSTPRHLDTSTPSPQKDERAHYMIIGADRFGRTGIEGVSIIRHDEQAPKSKSPRRPSPASAKRNGAKSPLKSKPKRTLGTPNASALPAPPLSTA